MSNLKRSVQAAITSYVESKKDTHTQVDVLRMIRDQASLFYERQLICDALDSDPMERLQHVRPQIKRIQSLMEVISSTRVETLDGYAKTNVVVEWKRDDGMKDVASNVRLTFHYERRLVQKENADSFSKRSQIIYTIEVAKDFGPRERLLTIEVWAVGEGPSLEPAEPLDEELWSDDDDDDAMDASTEDVSAKEAYTNDVAMSKREKKREESDRYAAYMDPETLTDLLTWTQLEMDEYTIFFFLMTFPFYEHEWDLVGYVLDAVFGETDDDDDEGDDDESGSDFVNIQEDDIEDNDSG